jgi:hypothetical protein
MRKVIFFVMVFIAMQGVLASGVSAQEFNHRIIVYASVVEIRAIFLNADGAIIKVSGNTTRNVEPRVFGPNNNEEELSDNVRDQYQRFLDSQGGHLAASRTYDVNPIFVSDKPNTQSIEVSATPAKLTLAF